MSPAPVHGQPPRIAPARFDEQLRYARTLELGTRLGLVLLVVTFVAYASGLTTPHVPLDRLPSLWHLPVDEYRRATAAPLGWRWLALAHRGDMATLLGIAVLAGCSMACVAVLLPLYHAHRERAYLALGAAQLAVLLLAASGVLATGH